MERIDDYVRVIEKAQERFDKIGYTIKSDDKVITFHNQRGNTLFRLVSGCEADDITVETKNKCYKTNEIMITCDTDGTPTLYFNSMEYGLILLNVDEDGYEQMFFI